MLLEELCKESGCNDVHSDNVSTVRRTEDSGKVRVDMSSNQRCDGFGFNLIIFVTR